MDAEELTAADFRAARGRVLHCPPRGAKGSSSSPSSCARPP